MRIEKKVHTLVLFRVWGARPAASGAAAASSGKITLTSPAGANLARFPARRVVFCGAYADDARFFGLVTSAAHASDDDEEDDEERSDAENKMLNARKTSTGNQSVPVHNRSYSRRRIPQILTVDSRKTRLSRNCVT